MSKKKELAFREMMPYLRLIYGSTLDELGEELDKKGFFKLIYNTWKKNPNIIINTANLKRLESLPSVIQEAPVILPPVIEVPEQKALVKPKLVSKKKKTFVTSEKPKRETKRETKREVVAVPYEIINDDPDLNQSPLVKVGNRMFFSTIIRPGEPRPADVPANLSEFPQNSIWAVPAHNVGYGSGVLLYNGRLYDVGTGRLLPLEELDKPELRKANIDTKSDEISPVGITKKRDPNNHSGAAIMARATDVLMAPVRQRAIARTANNIHRRNALIRYVARYPRIKSGMVTRTDGTKYTSILFRL